MSSRNDRQAAGAAGQPKEAALRSFGFDRDGGNDSWLESLREAEAPVSLGSIGPYELVEEVSRGGQGVVFKARQPGTKRMIALKRMVAGSLSSTSMRVRFLREIEAASTLNHPGIVTVYSMDTVDGLPIVAMEWIDGQPVNQWCLRTRHRQGTRDEASLPNRDPQEILEVFVRICDAVQHAHIKGIVHRDLKPSNILVDKAGQPHVLDFGLAKRFWIDAEDTQELTAEQVHRPSTLTRSIEVLGTPGYAAPEQLRGEGHAADPRTDVYSLGVILFEMLTGRNPFQGCASLVDTMLATERSRPPRPSTLNPRLGRELDVIVQKSMAKRRGDRYASVEALSSDVRRHLAGEPIHAVPPSSWYLLMRLIQRNKPAAAFVATVFLLLTAFAIHAKWSADRWEDEWLRAEKMTQNYVNQVRLYEALMAFQPDSLLRRADENPYYRELYGGPRGDPVPQIPLGDAERSLALTDAGSELDSTPTAAIDRSSPLGLQITSNPFLSVSASPFWDDPAGWPTGPSRPYSPSIGAPADPLSDLNVPFPLGRTGSDGERWPVWSSRWPPGTGVLDDVQEYRANRWPPGTGPGSNPGTESKVAGGKSGAVDPR